MPWVKSSESGSYIARARFSRHYPGSIRAMEVRYIKEYLDDNPTMMLRKGDIIQFNSGFFKRLHGWPSWFLQEEEKKQYWRKDKRTPVYARDQYAVVAGRYRKIKFKYHHFTDYGVVIMMLTGTKAGHIRNYYGCGNPFSLKSLYPQTLYYKKLIKSFSQNIIDIFHMRYTDTNEDRNLLLSRLYHELNLKGA